MTAYLLQQKGLATAHILHHSHPAARFYSLELCIISGANLIKNNATRECAYLLAPPKLVSSMEYFILVSSMFFSSDYAHNQNCGCGSDHCVKRSNWVYVLTVSSRG